MSQNEHKHIEDNKAIFNDFTSILKENKSTINNTISKYCNRHLLRVRELKFKKKKTNKKQINQQNQKLLKSVKQFSIPLGTKQDKELILKYTKPKTRSSNRNKKHTLTEFLEYVNDDVKINNFNFDLIEIFKEVTHAPTNKSKNKSCKSKKIRCQEEIISKE